MLECETASCLMAFLADYLNSKFWKLEHTNMMVTFQIKWLTIVSTVIMYHSKIWFNLHINECP